MRPSLGRVVLYTRTLGEEYAASITRVQTLAAADNDAARVNDEHAYLVSLAVDIHNGVRAERWYTTSITFSDAPMANTWRWPPKV